MKARFPFPLLLFACAPLLLSSQFAAAQSKACVKKAKPGVYHNVPFQESRYKLGIPSSYDGKTPLPLLVLLHSDAGFDIDIVGWGPIYSAKDNFILAAPLAPNGFSWRYDYPAASDYLDTFIAHLQKKLNIDGRRIYLAGWSGGSYFLSYYLQRAQDTAAAALLMFGGQNFSDFGFPHKCKIAAQFIQGSKDTITPAAATFETFKWLKADGHDVNWISIDSGHFPDNDEELIRTGWDFLSRHRLCAAATPKPCPR